MTTKLSSLSTEQNAQTVEEAALVDVFASSESVVEKAIADAKALQEAGETSAAIEKWRSLAILVEGMDDTLAAHAWFQAGSVLSDAGKYAEAVVAYGNVIRLQPDCGKAYLHRGTARNELEQYKAALADLERALCLCPDVASAIYSARGVAQSGLGAHAAARADHALAVQLTPRCALVYMNRGVSKIHCGAHEAAVADFDAALGLDATLAGAYHLRGYVKFFLSQDEAAIADFDTAIRLNPGNAVSYTNRGLIKHCLGEREAALADYEAAIRVAPNYAQPYTHRAEENLYWGREAAARADLAMALKLAREAGDEAHQSYVKSRLEELDEAEEDSN